MSWDLGLSQAAEAAALSVEERLEMFSFSYKGTQPQFNARVQQELEQRKQEQPLQGHEEFPDATSLTPPDSTQSSPITVQTLGSPLLPPTNSSTSAGKMPLATKAQFNKGQRSRKERNASAKRRNKVTPLVANVHVAPTQTAPIIQVGSPISSAIFCSTFCFGMP